MKALGLNEIRERFIKFFEKNKHYAKNSYSLVPKNDNSLLLINAGMAPMKNYFLGIEKPPNKNMVTCQKCIRTGDIENVGKTSRHATFFEMLGNFSFGDYFKEKSIKLGWEFLTKELEIPESKLWASVYLDDDEAYNIWKDKIQIPEDRIVRLGKEENFWEIGVGPCGPCSEIHFDRGEDYECEDECRPGDEGDRIIEIWNHVFSQYNKTEDGEYLELKQKNIDTGMGLERVACIMQDVKSIFDIDTIKKIRNQVTKMSDKDYGQDEDSDVSIRIITDHIRAITFMVSDGIMPGNSSREYVLRRLIRRAFRHGKLINIKGLFLNKLVDVVIEVSKAGYPELEDNKTFIKKVIKVEEENFQRTIDQGIELLDGYIKELKDKEKKVLNGKSAFKLHDTFGFPLDLTKEILKENGLKVDEKQYNLEMEKQRQRARKARENSGVSWEEGKNQLEDFKSTEFVGYDVLSTSAKVLEVIKNEDGKVSILLEKTPFYAESGGQISDQGKIFNDNFLFEVENVIKDNKNHFIHTGVIKKGNIEKGQIVKLAINKSKRELIKRNHTATHLLHKALKEVLGEHVKQAGSLVTDKQLRFDFTHFEKMTNVEIKEVEKKVNKVILDSINVDVINTSIKEAKKMGATALFDEKYGKNVRVIKVGDYSVELCGGTHIDNTSEIGVFKITSESAIASGTRRIEAITSLSVLQKVNEYETKIKKIASKLKTNKKEIFTKLDKLIDQNDSLIKKNEELKMKLAKSELNDLIKESRETINGIDTIIVKLDQVDSNTLRELSDNLINQNDEIFILLASKLNDKVVFLAKASESLVDQIHCGNIVREVAKVTNGGGGGRPSMAQAGGSDVTKIDEAVEKAKEIIKNL
ncbi:MAG: alanine--tRNA ligase [Bacillota bacterium]